LDVTDIKIQNIKSILNVLRADSLLTKRDISAITGLSFSTVSNLSNELRNAGVLVEEKSGDFSVGRTPGKLMFRTELYCSVCISLHTVDRMSLALLTFGNRQIYQNTIDITGMDSIDALLTEIRKAFEEARASVPAEIRFVAAGVSVPGSMEKGTGLIRNCSLALLEGQPFKALLEQKLGIPCYLDNDANLCALSKSSMPGGEERNNIVYINICSGLGIGAVCEGHLLHGAHGYAPEIAHLPLGDPQVACSLCGSTGCIEDMLSYRGFAPLKDASLSPEEREALFRDRGERLGELTAALINLFDPEVFYIGGDALIEPEHLFRYAEPVIRRRAYLSSPSCPRIIFDQNNSTTINRGISEFIYSNWDPLHM